MQVLERRLDLTAVVAISISAMLGSGIFVLPGLAAVATGPSVWLAYLIAALCVLPAALSTAELGTAMPTAGGKYVYLDRTFGPFVGTIAGLGLWLSLLLKGCFALLGLGVYLSVVVDIPVRPVALGMLVVALTLNVLGVHGVSRVQKLVTATAIAALVMLVAAGLWVAQPAPDGPILESGYAGLFSAVSLVVISFAGVTKTAAIAEEIQRPGRNLPAGILLSLAIVTILYSSVSYALARVIPMAAFTGDLRPIHTLAEATAGSTVAKGVAIIGVVTMASMATAGILAGSRFPFAMSRDRLLPSFFSRLHPRWRTPVPSILCSGAFMAAIIALFDIVRIAKFASAFLIAMFAGVCLAVIVLREAGVQWYKPKFRSPFYPAAQIFGLLSGCALLVAMGATAGIALLGVTTLSFLLFVLYSRHRVQRSGVVFKRSRRGDLMRGSGGSQVYESSNAGGYFETNGAIVVVLFGNERTPEMLVEIAEGLSGGGLEVVFLTEVPEQTMLSAVPKDPGIISVQRRIRAMAESHGLSIHFLTIPTYDIVSATHELSTRPEVEWLVTQWSGRLSGTFTISNPLGWFKDRVSVNMARFHDAGVRYIRRIMVHVEPGSHDTLVVSTADRLAQIHRATLTFVRFVSDDAGDRVTQESLYLEELRGLCSARSTQMIVRGRRRDKALGQATVDFDLLVTAESPERSALSSVFGTGSDRLTETVAACSVLRVQSPQSRTHATFDAAKAPAVSESALVTQLDPHCLVPKLGPVRKEGLFQLFASTFAASRSGLAEDILLTALWERERSQATALGQGVAMPHAAMNIGFTMLGVFTLQEPIDFGAPDGVGVDVFFVTIGDPTDRTTHLTLLSEISRILTQTDVAQELRQAETPEQIKKTMLSAVAASKAQVPVVAPAPVS